MQFQDLLTNAGVSPTMVLMLQCPRPATTSLQAGLTEMPTIVRKGGPSSVMYHSQSRIARAAVKKFSP